MGNICRSPTAHGLVRHRLRERGPGWPVRLDSAGTHGYHVGASPDARSLAAAARRGIDFRDLRARQVLAEDFHQFDLVLAMDGQNLSALARLRPSQARGELRLLLDYAPDLGVRDVPDPYYGGETGFEQVLDLIEAATEGLLADLQRRVS